MLLHSSSSLSLEDSEGLLLKVTSYFARGRVSFCAFARDCFELEFFLLLELKQIHLNRVVTKQMMISKNKNNELSLLNVKNFSTDEHFL